jgi:phosphoribosylamine--glycine ligase
MKVLVIGGGGREHALVWKIAQSPLVTKIYCSPGNAGISHHAECVDLPNTNFPKLIDFCRTHKIDLTVVGPEQPLVEGIVDEFKEAGVTIFGPSQAAAQLEGSKIFAKQFMLQYGIPTAPFHTFRSPTEAFTHVHKTQGPWVIKADGLAAGKGVIICQKEEHARTTITQMMEKKIFGAAGTKIIIENCLIGEEGSFIVITDGERIVPLATSQDHKQVYDGDEGPNTGGMGAYSPVPILEGEMKEKVLNTIIVPIVRGMQEEEIQYTGVLYAGLMIVQNEPYVLEFNVRFGDPETQPILARLKSDLVPILVGSAQGKISSTVPLWHDESALVVVAASGGYPGEYEKGKIITGVEKFSDQDDLVVFHAGTSFENESLITSGGRVLGVTALGKTLKHAQEKAYHALANIHFDKMHYRKDIGQKALTKG